MGNAKDLLNSLTDSEIAAYSANYAEEPHIVIGEDRVIFVPDELKRLGVQNDHDIETVTFDCPRYWDDNDLSTMTVYIQYMRSDKYIDSYIAKNVTVDETDNTIMHFDWTISKNVTSVPGELAFLICIRSINDEGLESNAWHSELCRATRISAGLECVDEHVIELNSDLITNMLTIVNECASDVSELDRKVRGIVDGSLIVKKAECDGYGNVISDTYSTPTGVDYQITEALSRDLHAVANSGDYNTLNNVPVIQYIGNPDISIPTSLNSIRETGVYIFSPNGGFEDVVDDWYSNNGLSKYGIYRITVNADIYTSPTALVTQLIECNNSILLRTFNYDQLEEYAATNIKETPLIINGVSVYATKEELESKVSEEITKIINGSPEALDTLNELAKALGNDPNFATTITNELSKKANNADLHAVAKSGDYGDLNNVPVIHYIDGSSDRPTSLNSLRETGVYVFSGTWFDDITDDNWYSNNGFSTWGRYRITVNKDHETGSTALVTQWIECNNSLLLRTFNFEFNDPTPFNIKETPMVINGVSVYATKEEVDNLKDMADTTYATKESVIPKISLWQPNTSYEVGNVVLDKDIESCYIIGVCKVAHISGSDGSYEVSSSGNWDSWSLQVQYARQSTYSDYANFAYSDGNGKNIVTTYATKAELRPTPITDISSTIVANKSYNYGEQTELSIAFPAVSNDGDVVYITFTSGATATVLTIDTTNTSDIELIPEANTGYEIYAKYNGTIWIVNYSDYTVTTEVSE